MLGKRSRPMIGKLTGALRSGIVDSMTSPRSPLDCRLMQSPSPRGLKSYYDQQGAVGLGIVVALDKSNNRGGGGEILAKYAICGPYSSRSKPIPINLSNNNNNNNNNNPREEDGLDEEFTYVTCHGPNKSITTRVYYDSGECCGQHRPTQNGGVFKISPASFSDEHRNSDSDFLSSCHLCRKTLHGKDIYMYRGEKAFCSAECRQRQIRIDERKEQCRSEASRSSEVSSSPYTYTSRGQIFSTGIVAV